MIKKIRIIGATGSGKSTIAKKISEKLGISHFELDDILYEKKYTIKRSEEERIKILDALCSHDSWICEGVSIGWTEQTFKQADIILYLQIPKRLLVKRLLRRHLQRYRSITKRRSLCNISNLFGLIEYGLNYDTKQIITNPIYVKYRDKVHIVRNKKELTLFLKSLK